MIARRRDEFKKKTASGISERHAKKDVVLDHIILEMDEKEETKRVEKELQSNKKKRPVAAGEDIRERALKRRNKDADDVQEEAVLLVARSRKRMRGETKLSIQTVQ